jgi:hypothetical protein
MTMTNRDRGWYPDPAGTPQQRLWDGSQWTVHYAAPPTWLDRKLAAPVAHPAPRGKKRVAAYFALILVVAATLVAPFAFLGFVMQGIGSGLQQAFTPIGKGVVVTSCAPTGKGRLAIAGTAHNDTTIRSDYFIGITVTDAAGRELPLAMATASNVAPGKTEHWTTTSPARIAGGVTCGLSTVLRVRHPLF